MKPGVFISHKLNDSVTDSFLGKLRPRLEAAGCHVWIDTDIAGGEVWRRELGTWMSCCTCAVILISRAALKSPWIFQEASILSWRKEQDKSFLLLPIVLDGVTDAEIGGSDLKVVLDLLQIQSPGRSGDEEAKLCGTITAVEKHLTEVLAGDDESARFSRAIAEHLKGADKSSISRAAATLGMEVDPWIPGSSPFSAIALKLLSAESIQLTKALNEVEIPRDKKGKIAQLILPFWVDTLAAGMIRSIALDQDDRPLLFLAIDHPETAEDYTRRASSSPHKTWDVHHSLNIYSEEPAAELWNELCNCIASSQGWNERITRNRDTMVKMVQRFLEIATKTETPLFFAIPVSEAANWTGLEDLRQSHPNVVYLTWGRAAVSDLPNFEGARAKFVYPGLSEEREMDMVLLRNRYNQ